HGEYRVGPLKVEMSIKPAMHGDSRVDVPPLGSISINSHDGPAQLSARIEQLDESKTQTLIDHPDRLDEASKRAPEQIGSAVVNLALRALIGVVLVSLLLGLIVFRSLWRTAVTVLVAVGLLAGVGGMAWATWHPESIREPRYEGLLTKVPAVVGDARSIYDNFGQYRNELRQFVTNMSGVYTNLSNIPNFKTDPNSIRILHVSDLHLNPAAWDVISSISEQFDVNAVVDTGDINDWGSKVEASFTDNIGKLGVPYVYIRGNHDSETTAEAVAKQPNAIVLDNDVRQVAGLTIAGTADGRLNADGDIKRLDKGISIVEAKDKQLAETIDQYDRTHSGDPVDVVMTHDPAGADAFTDSAPLVLAGHLHKRSVKRLDSDTLLKVEGSTGAAGLRGLYDPHKTASLEMSLLYFSTDGKLMAYDEITASGPNQSKLTLERKIVTNKTGK
ncbi:MAG: metallophosphoesterase family protein, partial [Mycobacteriales bacterium]